MPLISYDHFEKVDYQSDKRDNGLNLNNSIVKPGYGFSSFLFINRHRLTRAKGLHAQKFNTATHGLSSLRYTGTKALNSLKNDPVFNNVTDKSFPIWHLNIIEKYSDHKILIYFFFLLVGYVEERLW